MNPNTQPAFDAKLGGSIAGPGSGSWYQRQMNFQT